MASRAEIAHALNLTQRRVSQLAKEGIIPRAARGVYDWQEVVRAYLAYKERQDRGEETSLTDERTRLARVQADNIELDLAKKRGELVPTEWVAETFGRVFETFRARVLALPAKLAPIVRASGTNAEAQATLETALFGTLQALSMPKSSELARYTGETADRSARPKRKREATAKRPRRRGRERRPATSEAAG